jgi:hypothetical protein
MGKNSKIQLALGTCKLIGLRRILSLATQANKSNTMLSMTTPRRLFALGAFALLFLCTGMAHAGWLWPDHYYLITLDGGDEYTSKGEPWEKNEFTIFTQWPEKTELKIKTALVTSIRDTGSLSPEEIDAKENKEELQREERENKLKALFAISNQTHNPHFVPETLAQARKISNDEEITDILLELEGSFNFRGALQANYSLDEIAQHFKNKEEGKDIDPEGAKSDAPDPNRPYEAVSPQSTPKRDIFDEVLDQRNKAKSSH